METIKIPPHIILRSTKEVIFYLPKEYNSTLDIKLWMDNLNLTGYKGMTIKSKCIFNKLRDQNYK
tara:strand:- start:124 stop:318 length:195 start_codon:yes stop_codon:yes gene_type:complete